MSDNLFPYYERELLFIREFSQEFARKYPAAAGRLMLEANRSGDPHIERLIESFALVAGRIHRKLDDDFPELTDAMLGVLFPHYLAPVPSMAVVQFALDPAQADLPEGFLIRRGSKLQTTPVGDLRCTYRTCYPAKLWPVRIAAGALQSPPFPAGLSPPPRTASALRLEIECMGKLSISDLAIDALRVHLSGSNHLITSLYELIFNHTKQVVFRSLDDPSKQAVFSPEECLFPVGFQPDEGMLPYPPQSPIGYRLLTEFFTFPAKFLFVDVRGWQRLARMGFGPRVEVMLFLDRAMPRLEPEIDREHFRLGCVPIVNLFEQIAEPIQLNQSKFEYRVVADVQNQLGKEVYSVDSVTSTDPTTSTATEYFPFYRFDHGAARGSRQAFWYASRRPPAAENDRGTEVYLNLVDRAFDPRQPAVSTLIVRATCTNRDLPNQLQHAGEDLHFELQGAAPISRVRCVEFPTPPLRPPLRRGAHWALVSHLNLNYLSIGGGEQGVDALRQILRLYDFSDPEAGQQQLAEVTRQLIEGITAVSTRRVVGRVDGGGESGLARGIEVTIEFDEEKYVGTGMFLFASVLERFLGHYASINSFSQLVGTTKQRETPFKKWPPRAAQHTLV